MKRYPTFTIARRLETFHAVLERDPAGRAALVSKEIEEIISREEEMKTILRLGAEGKIPLRITHNDTKFNNILLTAMTGHCLSSTSIP
jgi:thiamine kinase-like enzyme